MKKQTELENVKKVATWLLNVPVMETDFSPMIVSHPFTKSGLVVVPAENEYFQIDITNNEQSLNKWKSLMEQQINKSSSAKEIYYLLNDSYRLLFVSEASKFLSSEEFSELLGMAWICNEYANEDPNVSRKTLLSHFKNADKKSLMSKEEFEEYQELGDMVVVYRGASKENKNQTKAFSWTTSFSKAKWFAERFGSGVIYSATIDKDSIFAYFTRANENEIILDFNKLQNIKPTTKPQPKPETQSEKYQ